MVNLQNISLNNAPQVIDSLKCDNASEQHLIIVESQGSGREPVITDSNIRNNATFILNLWD